MQQKSEMGVYGGRDSIREKKQDVGDIGGRLLVGPGGKKLNNIYENKAFTYSPVYFCCCIMSCTTNFDPINVTLCIISALLTHTLYEISLCST